MRAWDITVLIICFEFALQLIIGCALYSPDMICYTPQQDPILDVTGYTTANSNATQKLLDGAKQPTSDSFSMGVGLIAVGNLFINIIGAALFVYWPLTAELGVPPLIAGIIQGLIYISYTAAIIQFTSRSYVTT